MTAPLRLDQLGVALAAGTSRGPDPPPPPLVGAWTVGAPLGRGGSSTVYDARRPDGTRAALKVARSRGDGLNEEAEMLSRAASPGVVALLEAGALPDGRRWLALERLDGLPITARVRELEGCARMRLFARLCEAVSHLHSRAVVHADLKPSNAFDCDDGRTIVLDLGSASGSGTVLAAAGGRAMTPEFAAPEQLVGGVLTPATDTYALGLLLHDMLCGRSARVPWALGGGITRFETIAMSDPSAPWPGHRRRRARPARRTPLDARVQRLLTRALATDPADRFPTALALGATVNELLDTLPDHDLCPSVSDRRAASR